MSRGTPRGGPFIPVEELHASSVQHPRYPQYRWLVHTRRVPMIVADAGPFASSGASQLAASNSSAPQSVDALPACAGIGDPDMYVWACWDCVSDLCAKKPKMPLNGLTNDNWIGREKVYAREATKATKMLASLGRCCWKQVRLGKGAPHV